MYPYTPPPKSKEPPVRWTPSAVQNTTNPHSGCMILYLVVMGIFSAIALVVLIAAVVSLFNRMATRTVPWGYVVVTILAVALFVVILISLWGIRKWKRWGVYGLVGALIGSVFIRTSLASASASDCIAPLVQLAILYVLVHDRWDEFE